MVRAGLRGDGANVKHGEAVHRAEGLLISPLVDFIDKCSGQSRLVEQIDTTEPLGIEGDTLGAPESLAILKT